VRTRGLIASWLAVAVLLAAASVQAEHGIGNERIDFTAYTLRANETSLGVGAAAYGLLDEITVGTYVLPWFAFPLVNAPIASGYIKVRDWAHGPIAASLRAAFVYLPQSTLAGALANDSTTRVGFIAVPVEASLSARVHARFSQSLQLSWVHAAVDGIHPRNASLDLRVGGASAVTTLTLSSLSEVRITPMLALTVRMSVLLWHGDLTVRGELERDGTRVDAKLGSKQLYDGFVANVIPGIAFSWANVNLHLGVGVGSNWLPFFGLPIRVITAVPDADFYVRF
jgi:hypothetical protein